MKSYLSTESYHLYHRFFPKMVIIGRQRVEQWLQLLTIWSGFVGFFFLSMNNLIFLTYLFINNILWHLLSLIIIFAELKNYFSWITRWFIWDISSEMSTTSFIKAFVEGRAFFFLSFSILYAALRNIIPTNITKRNGKMMQLIIIAISSLLLNGLLRI